MSWLGSLRRLARDKRGMSAVEFALIAPVMAVMLVGMVEAWGVISRHSETQAASTAGIRYYHDGGTDDTAAQAFALAAWPNKPGDGAVNVSRSCKCGSTVVSCTYTCSGGSTPNVWVTIRAQSAWNGQTIDYSEVIRVR